jgi:hypothetical protein
LKGVELTSLYGDGLLKVNFAVFPSGENGHGLSGLSVPCDGTDPDAFAAILKGCGASLCAAVSGWRS